MRMRVILCWRMQGTCEAAPLGSLRSCKKIISKMALVNKVALLSVGI